VSTAGSVLQVLLPVLKVLGFIAVLLLVYLAIDLYVHERREAKMTQNPFVETKRIVRENSFLTSMAIEVVKIYMHVRQNRDEREKSKFHGKHTQAYRDSFFENPYASGFHPSGELIERGLSFDSAKTKAYEKLFGELEDTQIFQNTEVL
jgi:NADH:ubiquinone oxidoreductase subunit 3 (subunit A)